MNEETRNLGAHNLILEERGHLTVTGVADIDSFDEETVVVYTEMGELTIRGSELHINKIDVEAGELNLEGEIDSLSYSDQPAVRGGFFARMFR